MARKSPNGSYILSASEVGAYTVCPESWRLRSVERIRSAGTDRMKEGRKLHDFWAADLDESRYLRRGVRMVLSLITVAVGLVLLSRAGALMP